MLSLKFHAVRRDSCISVNYFIVKRSSKIFENSFLKNGMLEFLSEAFTIFILTYSSNDD